MRTSLIKLVSAGAALIFASAQFVSARTPALARPQRAGLPTLRLDYYAFISKSRLGQITSLDPAHIQTEPDFDVSSLMVNANLVRILPDGTVGPDLATYSTSKNHLIYTFTIRGNARFSNGHYVTAQDAAYSLQRALDPATQSEIADQYDNLIVGADDFFHGRIHTIGGLKVLSPRVLQITITKPVAYFLETLANSPGDVLDPSVVRGTHSNAKTDYLTQTCAGNQGAGPFRFVCRDHSSTVHSFYSGNNPSFTLVPNTYYYGPRPHVRIVLPMLAGQDYRAYQAGQIDMARVPTVYLGSWKGSRELHEYPASAVWYLVPNTHLAPFNNVHCRLAVAYAIDRKTIAGNVLRGTVRPTYAIVPPGMLGYYTGADNPHYSPTRARAELARCPGRTVPFQLKYNADDADSINRAIAIGAMLSAAGLNVKLTSLPHLAWGETITNSLDATHTQLVFDEWIQDYPDPADYCTLLLRSGRPHDTGGWRNAVYDRLVDRAELTYSRKERAALYIQAQHLALSQGALIALYVDRTFKLIKPYVHGLVTTEAYYDPVPRGLNWANVSVGGH